MIIAGTDTETTGLEVADGHKIIEICFRVYDSDTRKLIDSYVQRVNPKRPIDAKAQAVHGISFDELVNEPVWEDVAPRVNEILTNADLMVAHNMAFDGPFIGYEQTRAGLTLPAIETFCTMEEGRWATPLGKKPSLKELCFALGYEYDPSAAHAADYDVDRMMECLFAGMDRGFFVLPEIERATQAA